MPARSRRTSFTGASRVSLFSSHLVTDLSCQPVLLLYAHLMTGHRFEAVAQDLRDRIAQGRTGPSGALDSEAEIGRRHGVSRVTVRRALETLRDEGLVVSRAGSGWYVAGTPVRQRLGRRRRPARTVGRRRHRRRGPPRGAGLRVRGPTAGGARPAHRRGRHDSRRGAARAVRPPHHRRGRPHRAAGPHRRVGAGRPGRTGQPRRRGRPGPVGDPASRRTPRRRGAAERLRRRGRRGRRRPARPGPGRSPARRTPARRRTRRSPRARRPPLRRPPLQPRRRPRRLARRPPDSPPTTPTIGEPL